MDEELRKVIEEADRLHHEGITILPPRKRLDAARKFQSLIWNNWPAIVKAMRGEEVEAKQ